MALKNNHVVIGLIIWSVDLCCSNPHDFSHFIYEYINQPIKLTEPVKFTLQQHAVPVGTDAVADPGGGGGQGVRTPPFGPRCRLFNIGPKVGPPPFLLVDHPSPPPWNVDDVTRAMSKGGGGGCL